LPHLIRYSNFAKLEQLGSSHISQGFQRSHYYFDRMFRAGLFHPTGLEKDLRVMAGGYHAQGFITAKQH